MNYRFLLVFIFFCSALHAQKWTRLDSCGVSNDYASVSCSENGQSFFVGAHFRNTAQIGNDTLVANGINCDISLTKYNSIGDVIWTKKFGGPEEDYLTGIGLYNGYIYVTGCFNDSTTFDNIHLTGNGLYEIFLAKLDSNGNLIWLRNAGSDDSDYSEGLTIDIHGNIYITGAFDKIATFGSFTVTETGYPTNQLLDLFLAKYDSLGNVAWVTSDGGLGNDRGLSVEYSNNSLYITGLMEGGVSATFGTTSLNSNGQEDMILLRYDLDGNNIWARGFGSTGSEAGFDLISNTAGNIIVAGIFDHTVDFGGTILSSQSNSEDIVVASYDTTGNLIWAKRAGGGSWDQVHDVALDSLGNIYICGLYSTIAHFGTISISSSGLEDIFVASYDAWGNIRWVKHGGGSGDYDRGWSVCPLKNGVIFMSGRIGTDVAHFDCLSATNLGYPVMQIVAEISFPPNPDIALGNDTILCPGDSLLLSPMIPNATYIWQNNTTDSTFTVNQAGTYWVNISAAGCVNSDTLHVTFNTTNVSINFGADTTICPGQTINLDATNQNAFYSWQDNSSSPILSVNQPGIYWAYASNGCTMAVDTIAIFRGDCIPSFFCIPTILIGEEQFVISGLEPGSSLYIFDMRGRIVFHSSDYNNDFSAKTIAAANYLVVLSKPSQEIIRQKLSVIKH